MGGPTVNPAQLAYIIQHVTPNQEWGNEISVADFLASQQYNQAHPSNNPSTHGGCIGGGAGSGLDHGNGAGTGNCR